MNPRPLLVTLAALALAAPAAAQTTAKVVDAGGLADLAGPRTLALGGSTALVQANDGLLSNPGSVAARRRYSVESLFAVDRRGGSNAGRYLGLSVVDALSGPVAASFAWVHPMEGFQDGNLFLVGLAGKVGEGLYLGAQGRYLAIREDLAAGGQEKVSVVTADAGLLWEVSELISVGVAGFNLVPTGHERSAPRSMAAGLAIGSDTSFRLVGDWRADFDRNEVGGKPATTNRYSVGVEAFLGNMVPVRAGWLKDEVLKTSWWSGGVGLVTASGVAIDVGYRQSLDRSDVRVISAAFKMQFLE